ncbi:ATP-dependent 6-phosphofructokinase [Alterileibacterium massiliense]|uniref:ATP-dependent 6-phosphofructokinase n=1 Tax=Alterileibacterium massiliense TaxID=1870997 RepID=UPI0008DB2F4A|nr:ATP-dependent 6-phosphofructokinase [Alterileibacterium massiliense]
MSRIGVLTSGGDAPGMNAAVRAIVRYGIEAELEVYGIYKGYEGLINGLIKEMNRRSVSDILQRGGTILKTARSEEFKTEEGVKKGIDRARIFNLDLIVVIGGNGSFRGAKAISDMGMPVICIPCTIDNDLAYTEQTIGFDTAINTVLEAITRIRDTSSAHERTTVIEVMGRECGDLALYSGLAGGAEVALVPELVADMDYVCMKVMQGVNSGKQHSIIVKAEGYPVSTDDIVKEVAKRTGRSVKPVVLSYLQRGGSPSLRDRLIATECADVAINLIKAGEYNRAVGIINGKVTDISLSKALEAKRTFNEAMYNSIDILSK